MSATRKLFDVDARGCIRGIADADDWPETSTEHYIVTLSCTGKESIAIGNLRDVDVFLVPMSKGLAIVARVAQLEDLSGIVEDAVGSQWIEQARQLLAVVPATPTVHP